jgi:hypothetical protein
MLQLIILVMDNILDRRMINPRLAPVCEFMWVSNPLGRGNDLLQIVHLCILFFRGALVGTLAEGPDVLIPLGKEEIREDESDWDVE